VSDEQNEAVDEPLEEEGDEPVQVPMPQEEEDTEEEDTSPADALSFCELCGASEDDDDELLRCEECGRLHCSNCRVYDEDGATYCEECGELITDQAAPLDDDQ